MAGKQFFLGVLWLSSANHQSNIASYYPSPSHEVCISPDEAALYLSHSRFQVRGLISALNRNVAELGEKVLDCYNRC
jgi:hypothetical protein